MESRDELRAREHTRTYAMAAMTGAEFRRRDACQARGPVVSTTVGASGWSVERSTWWRRERGRGRERARGGGKLGGIALGTTPNPWCDLEPLSFSLDLPRRGAAPTLRRESALSYIFPFISFSELHSYSYRCPFSNSYPSATTFRFAVPPFLVLVFRRSIRARCLASWSLYRGTEIKEFRRCDFRLGGGGSFRRDPFKTQDSELFCITSMCFNLAIRRPLCVPSKNDARFSN